MHPDQVYKCPSCGLDVYPLELNGPSGTRFSVIVNVAGPNPDREHNCLVEMQAIINSLQERHDRLANAIRTHRSQKADDRCIEDDDRLYASLEDGIKCDRRVGSKEEMLRNCARFIQNRCHGGGWPTYAQREAQLQEARAFIESIATETIEGVGIGPRQKQKAMDVLKKIDEIGKVEESVSNSQINQHALFNVTLTTDNSKAICDDLYLVAKKMCPICNGNTPGVFFEQRPRRDGTGEWWHCPDIRSLAQSSPCKAGPIHDLITKVESRD